MTGGENVKYTEAEIDPKISKLLQYHWRTIPFGFIWQGSAESHINHPSQIVPLYLQAPGKTFGLLSFFDHAYPSNLIKELYSTAAGCRSLLLLPKVSHQLSNKRLQRLYRLSENVLYPRHFGEQYPLLQSITKSEKFMSDWRTEIVFFTNEFTNAIDSNFETKSALQQYVWG